MIICLAVMVFISIHASRGGSDLAKLTASPTAGISIHASRGGSDQNQLYDIDRRADISIHASRGGSDISALEADTWTPRFQSTLPAGEATSA